MKETTCKKLQEIGAFALAGGCTRKRMKQLVEMIRAARNYRWLAVYKIVKDEFVILAGTGNEPPAYPRFPITQGLCGAALDSGKADHCRRRAQGSASSACVSHDALGDHCPDEEQRPPAHSRNDGRGERQAERVWRRRSTISGARRRFDRALFALARRVRPSRSNGETSSRAPSKQCWSLLLFRPNLGSKNRRRVLFYAIAMMRHAIGLEIFRNPEDAIEIARYDDDGNYRPLKTAPNLRHGWRMEAWDDRRN